MAFSSRLLTGVSVLLLILVGIPAKSAPNPIADWYQRLRSDPWAGPYIAMPDVDSQPRIIRQEPPYYPRADRAASIEGVALVAFVVAPDGCVREGRVLEASRPEFGEEALKAVKTWLWQPAKKGGSAVPKLLIVPISFRLGKH
jgi:TonB family protein